MSTDALDPISCPSCHALNPADHTYCGRCGAPLRPASPYSDMPPNSDSTVAASDDTPTLIAPAIKTPAETPTTLMTPDASFTRATGAPSRRPLSRFWKMWIGGIAALAALVVIAASISHPAPPAQRSATRAASAASATGNGAGAVAAVPTTTASETPTDVPTPADTATPSADQWAADATNDTYRDVNDHPDAHMGDKVVWTCKIAKFLGQDSNDASSSDIGCTVDLGNYDTQEVILKVPASIDTSAMHSDDQVKVYGTVDQPMQGKTLMGVDATWTQVDAVYLTDTTLGDQATSVAQQTADAIQQPTIDAQNTATSEAQDAQSSATSQAADAQSTATAEAINHVDTQATTIAATATARPDIATWATDATDLAYDAINASPSAFKDTKVSFTCRVDATLGVDPTDASRTLVACESIVFDATAYAPTDGGEVVLDIPATIDVQRLHRDAMVGVWGRVAAPYHGTDTANKPLTEPQVTVNYMVGADRTSGVTTAPTSLPSASPSPIAAATTHATSAVIANRPVPLSYFRLPASVVGPAHPYAAEGGGPTTPPITGGYAAPQGATDPASYVYDVTPQIGSAGFVEGTYQIMVYKTVDAARQANAAARDTARDDSAALTGLSIARVAVVADNEWLRGRQAPLNGARYCAASGGVRYQNVRAFALVQNFKSVTPVGYLPCTVEARWITRTVLKALYPKLRAYVAHHEG